MGASTVEDAAMADKITIIIEHGHPELDSGSIFSINNKQLSMVVL
jgi:hypothetical protein